MLEKEGLTDLRVWRHGSPSGAGGGGDRHAVENINLELGDSLVQHPGDARSWNILGVCYGISLVTDVRYC